LSLHDPCSIAQVCFDDVCIKIYGNRNEIAQIEEMENLPDNQLHSHLMWECHIVTLGSVDFQFEREMIPLQAGEMLWIPPNMLHYPFPKESQNSEIVYHFTIEGAARNGSLYSYFSETLDEMKCRTIRLNHELLHRFIKLSDLFKCMTIRDYCYLQKEAYACIFMLFDSFNGFRFRDNRRNTFMCSDNKLILLEKGIQNARYSLKDIAEELGYTPRHTARLIRQIYGKCLYDLRDEMGLPTACKFIRETPELPLETVAYQSGFRSYHSMRRAFKKLKNTTPAQYRDEVVKQNSQAKR